MSSLISTRARRIGCASLVFVLAVGAAISVSWQDFASAPILMNGEIMMRFLVLPALAAIATFALLSACAPRPEKAITAPPVATSAAAPQPFMAQVVGV